MTTNLAISINSYKVIDRREQTEADKLVYTKKAAARLLNVEYGEIEFVYVGFDYVLVGMYNNSVKLTKSEFTTLFVEDRFARSKSLTVTQNVQNATQYTVRNEDNGHRYHIQVKTSSIYCECADYHKQIQA